MTKKALLRFTILPCSFIGDYIIITKQGSMKGCFSLTNIQVYSESYPLSENQPVKNLRFDN